MTAPQAQSVPLDSVERAVAEIAAGRAVVVVDDATQQPLEVRGEIVERTA